MVEPGFCQKGVSLDEVMSNSAKFKPIALVVIELCLSEGIGKVEIRSVGWLVSQSVGQSVSQFVENLIKQKTLKILLQFLNGLGMI